MPLDANAAKIGGHIMFKNERNQIEVAEVTGYDHLSGLHSVVLGRVGLQLVSLNDPNLRYIPKPPAQTPMSQAAATSKQTSRFMIECMSVDYPSMSRL